MRPSNDWSSHTPLFTKCHVFVIVNETPFLLDSTAVPFVARFRIKYSLLIILFCTRQRDTPLPDSVKCCPLILFVIRKNSSSLFPKEEALFSSILWGDWKSVEKYKDSSPKRLTSLNKTLFVTHRYRSRRRWGHMVITDARGQANHSSGSLSTRGCGANRLLSVVSANW